MDDLIDAAFNQSSCGGLSEEFGEISVQIVIKLLTLIVRAVMPLYCS